MISKHSPRVHGMQTWQSLHHQRDMRGVWIETAYGIVEHNAAKGVGVRQNTVQQVRRLARGAGVTFEHDRACRRCGPAPPAPGRPAVAG